VAAQEVVMKNPNADTTVVDLQSHPRFQAAQRYSEEFEAAMRRHPSYQARLLPCQPTA
jgi:hypothetical protein